MRLKMESSLSAHETQTHSMATVDTALFNIMPDALIVVDLSGNIRRVNDQLINMFGYDDRELLGQPVEILLPERVRQRHVHNRKNFQLKPTVRSMGAGLDLRGCRKNGSEFPVDIMLSPLPSADGLVLAVVRDITLNKKMHDELRRLAFSDPLTNLPNRTALYDDLQRHFSPGSGNSNAPVSIGLFDLDGFKEVNDTLGHSAGDKLLTAVTQRWTAAIGDLFRIYRLGGDEFIVLIPQCGDPRRAEAIIKSMLQTLEKPFQIIGKTVHVGASAGIAIAPADGSNVESLLSHVDLALYQAKAEGRGRSVFFRNSMHSESEARRNIDLQLRRAHADGELELYYQPQVRLADSSLVGAEALLRWRRGGIVVSPGAFIDALAASSISTKVGNWIIRTACETAAAWRCKDLMPIRIAVNLFPTQFHEPSFIAEVQKALSDARLPPEALELEITENIALRSDASTFATLHKLRDMGIRLALDDFGTGFGSLSYLTQMPLTHIKIDQSFIRELPDHSKPTAIVRSLIGLAHDIGLEIIAEGVETNEQANFLRLEGCDEAQGFLFAKPVPSAAFEALLRNSTKNGHWGHFLPEQNVGVDN
ncbi:MAG: putative bifunctional diguanylate cyclase/phosphodiesterase [Devosia sp.]